MKYDFDLNTDRRGTNASKWLVGENELPMWIADMDFKTAPQITDAICKRADHGIFGYTEPDDEWEEAYINWWKARHGLDIKKGSLIFCTGIVPAISSIVRKLTTPNENVLIQSPVYNIFYNSIINNGARVLESPLIYDGESYRMDFDDLEKKMADPQTSLMILCNPHNPVGRIWSKEELAKVGSLALQYHVTVISDEIHCDIVRPGLSYVPFASVSKECEKVSITCIAPTKAFNLAGLQTAAVMVPDEFLRHKVWRGLNTDEVAEPNAFAVLAPIAAFNESGDWLDEMREYVFENRKVIEDYIKTDIPSIKCVKGDATYLVWIDISSLNSDGNTVASFLREKTGLYLSAGNAYGTTGENFLRLNAATSRERITDGLSRLKNGIKMFINR